MSRPSICAALAALVSLVAGSFAPATIIDDFSFGPLSLEVIRFQQDSVTQTSLPTGQVLGGSRFVTLSGRGPTPQSSVEVDVDPASGHFH
jgi:hypothetical protein